MMQTLMPATRPSQLRNPLRKLRVAIGNFGQPMSQEEFARLIGIRYPSLQSVENGRRPLQPDLLEQIREILWAVWDEGAQEWRPLWDRSRVYTKEDAQTIAELWPRDPYVQDLMVHALLARLLAICEATEPAHLLTRIMRLNRLLGRYAKDSGLAVDLEPTEPIWFLSNNPNVWGRALSQEKIMWAKYRGYLYKQALPPRSEAGGIFDFRSHRHYNPAEYPAESPEEVETIVQKRTHRTKKPRENRGTLRAPKRVKSRKTLTNNEG